MLTLQKSNSLCIEMSWWYQHYQKNHHIFLLITCQVKTRDSHTAAPAVALTAAEHIPALVVAVPLHSPASAQTRDAFAHVMIVTRIEMSICTYLVPGHC